MILFLKESDGMLIETERRPSCWSSSHVSWYLGKMILSCCTIQCQHQQKELYSAQLAANQRDWKAHSVHSRTHRRDNGRAIIIQAKVISHLTLKSWYCRSTRHGKTTASNAWNWTQLEISQWCPSSRLRSLNHRVSLPSELPSRIKEEP